MTQTRAVILCLAYILGLLSTYFWWGGCVLLALGVGLAVLSLGKLGNKKVRLSFWQADGKTGVWLVAGIIGFLASLYFQLRVPHPAVNDISQFVPAQDSSNQEHIVTIHGTLVSTPHLTRNQRGQFWLTATQLDDVKGGDGPTGSKGVSGKLYVTVPLLQMTGLHEGQEIAITGILYKPKPVANPGAFDFQGYLEREGTFAGLSGTQVSFPDEQEHPHWGWWKIQQRIIRSQIRWLGSPEGPLVSSMILGHRVVDLPYDIKDLFVQIGLAHAIAAAGFQTSLVLGLVLALVHNLSTRAKFVFGSLALVIFVGLTGCQPSVMRAAIMGFGALLALVTLRKVRRLGLVLLAATLLLLFNPLWIWDLGFELSFLATLGLAVTMPPLIKLLDWLPPAFASLIAVPITALIWTLPLQLHVFGVVPLYSLIVNLLATPLISIISVGGLISALAAIVWPFLGSALSWLLYYPAHWLIGLVAFFCQLPGNSVAVGTIAVWQLLTLYGLIVLAWLQPWWQKRWWFAGVLAVSLVLVPIWQTQATLSRVTVLAAAAEPVMVIQDQGKVLLINSGDSNTARFTVLPFLQQQGVNQINCAIAINAQPSKRSGWLAILERLAVKNFYGHPTTQTSAISNQTIEQAVQKHHGTYLSLKPEERVTLGSTSFQVIDDDFQVLQLKTQGQTWLWLGDIELSDQKQLAASSELPKIQVLLWSGEALASDLLDTLKPQVAIASSATIDQETASALRKRHTKVFWTGRDGAIQWTPQGNFEAMMEPTENYAIF